MRPTAVSHGHRQGFLAEFSWTGTMDFSAWLAVPACIEFHDRMGGRALMQRNHDVCVKAAGTLADRWNTTLITDDDACRAGSMCVVELPHGLFPFRVGGDLQPGLLQSALVVLHRVLLDEYHIECMPVVIECRRPGIRISVQMYNDEADFERLGAAILDIVKRPVMTDHQ